MNVDSARTMRAPASLALALMVVASMFVSAPMLRAEVKADGVGPALSPDPNPSADPRAVRQLERTAKSASRVAYTGEQFVSAWSSTGTSSTLIDVSNMPGTGTALRVRGSGDGPSSAVFAEAPGDDLGVGLGVRTVRILVDNYTVRYAGTATTAGRQAHVVKMFAAEGVPAATFWIDKRSGVLLRREVFDGEGRTVRASAFVDLHIGTRGLPDHLPPMLATSSAQTLNASQVSDLRANGWELPNELAAAMTIFDVRSFDVNGATGLHLSYSDGLSTVSVFEQHGTLDVSGLDGYEATDLGSAVVHVRAGIPQQVVWSAGGTVYTVLADAPADTVDEIVAALPHDSAATGGVVDRMGRGLGRVGSWINPFA